MHAEDPVAWRPWNAAAFAEARRRNVPLLVSVGFFACHWCHRLQGESYRNAQTAALINRHFVAVKVDRELESGLDSALQAFAHRHAGRRGWPVQVLVTPDGHAAAAGFYEPPAAFRATLAGWAKRWGEDREALVAGARAVAASSGARSRPRIAPGAGSVAALRERFVADALERADLLRGGFGSTAKFPSAPQVLALLELQHRGPDPRLAEILRVTLDTMHTQGLRDHLRGGFFRYTADPDWSEPHFEKMLADNALLALAYLRAAGVLREPRYRNVALETLDFMRRELWDARAGAFVAGLSAQSARGIDGGRYRWTLAELAKTLPAPERTLVMRIWGASAASAHTDGVLPREALAPGAAERKLLESAYARLRAARASEKSPRDGKLLAGWNGIALAALSAAAPTDAGAARDAAALRRFIERALWDGKRLRKLGGSAGAGAGELDDYAFVAWGLARYAAFTGSAADRTLGAAIARAAWDEFYRDGWMRQRKPLLAGLEPEAVLSDGYAPSPSATLVLASLRLGDEALAAQARNALALAERPPPEGAFAWATQLVAHLGPE